MSQVNLYTFVPKNNYYGCYTIHQFDNRDSNNYGNYKNINTSCNDAGVTPVIVILLVANCIKNAINNLFSKSIIANNLVFVSQNYDNNSADNDACQEPLENTDDFDMAESYLRCNYNQPNNNNKKVIDAEVIDSHYVDDGTISQSTESEDKEDNTSDYELPFVDDSIVDSDDI